MYIDTFQPAASSLREEVFAFAAREYNTIPEYPWAKSPGYAVLRHTDNRKWYGVIMEVPRKRLGIDTDGANLPTSPDVDILNVKCDPVLSGSLRMQPGILPAYHMNKENWISILLDGTVDVEQIFTFLDMSFELTARKAKAKTSAVHNTNIMTLRQPSPNIRTSRFSGSRAITFLWAISFTSISPLRCLLCCLNAARWRWTFPGSPKTKTYGCSGP